MVLGISPDAGIGSASCANSGICLPFHVVGEQKRQRDRGTPSFSGFLAKARPRPPVGRLWRRAPLAGGLHNPFSVNRLRRNAVQAAAAGGAVWPVELLITPTMARAGPAGLAFPPGLSCDFRARYH